MAMIFKPFSKRFARSTDKWIDLKHFTLAILRNFSYLVASLFAVLFSLSLYLCRSEFSFVIFFLRANANRINLPFLSVKQKEASAAAAAKATDYSQLMGLLPLLYREMTCSNNGTGLPGLT
jgi:hypothetical protein